MFGYPLILAAFLFVFVIGSLRYSEAEKFFAALFIKTLLVLMGAYMAYRLCVRRVLKGRDLDKRVLSDEFDDNAEYLRVGRGIFLDRVVRLGMRVVALALVAFLLRRWWEPVGLFASNAGADDGDVTIVNVLSAFAALILTAIVVRLLRGYMTFFFAPRVKLDQGTAYTFVTLASYGVIAVGIIVALNILQVKSDQIAVVMSALMLGIGFGLQSIVKNFVSGLILLVERPVQVGDRVEIGGRGGKVEKITLRATSVMTWDGVGIVIPNEEMIGGQLVNQSLGRPRLRSEIVIGVGYGSDVDVVRTLLEKIVKEHGLVLKRPGAQVFFTGFGDSSLDFCVRYWTAMSTHRGLVSSDIRYAIDAAFRRENIEIPFPQRDVNLRHVESPGLSTAPDKEEEAEDAS